jgi:polyisoprenoid-binding protein YceI
VLGPRCGRVRARTFRTGLAKTVGHDLLIEFTRWEAEVVIPADSAAGRLSAAIETASFTALEGTGGVMPLDDDDRREIAKTALRLLAADRHPTMRFEAELPPTDGSRATLGPALTGTLKVTVAGAAAPVELAVEETSPGHVRVTGTVLQSAHGIKPYSAFLGALKLRDAVDVEIEVDLPPPE